MHAESLSSDAAQLETFATRERERRLFERVGNRLTIRIRGRIAERTKNADGCCAQSVASAIQQHGDAQALMVRINSDGGDVYGFEAIEKAIRNFRGRSLAVVDAVAGSGAALLAISCDRLFVRRGARIMFHRSQMAAYGNCHALRDQVRFLSMMDARWLLMLRKRCGTKHEREIREAFETERWIECDDALRLGIADAIAPALLTDP